MTDENGPLKVMPGSHHSGKTPSSSGRAPVTILGRRGDVLLMRPLLSHCSNKSAPGTKQRRRILHYEFSGTSELPDGYAWHDYVRWTERRCWDLERADIHDAVGDAREASLVGFAGGDENVVPLVDGGAAEQEGDGEGGATVVGEAAEARIGNADVVVVDAVGQAACAASADQVEGAGGVHGAGDVVGAVVPPPWKLPAMMVL